MTNLQNQSGRSMIEMLGVLAIIGVLSVGGIAGYSKAMLKYKTNKTIDEVTMLTTNIRTLYAQQKVFTGLDTSVHNANGDQLGVVPDELQGTGSNLTNPFSGSVVVTVGNSIDGDAGANRAFVIEVNGLPKEACMAIATSDRGSNYSSGLIGMSVVADGTTAATASGKLSATYAGCKGTAGTLTSDAICAADMPISVAAASTACACEGSKCSVAFKYY